MPLENGASAIAIPLDGAGAVGRFDLTGQARGPWQDDAAHGGAPAGLLARAAESLGLDEGMRLASMQLTFNGPVHLGEVEVTARIVKPGRRQRVAAVAIEAGGRKLIEGRAVLMRLGEVDLPPEAMVEAEFMAGPEGMRPVDREKWADGSLDAFHRTAISAVSVSGGPDRVGSEGAGWLRLDVPLIEGERPSGAQRALTAADFGNGMAHPVPWGEYLFVNCDLSVCLLREPVGEWIGLQSRTEVHPVGTGLTSTRLFDSSGSFGRATQILFVERV